MVKKDQYKNNISRRYAMAAAKYKSVTELFKQSSQIVRRNLYPFIVVNILAALSIVWQMGINLRDKTNGTSWSSVFQHGVFGNNGDYHYPGAGAGILAFIFIVASVMLALMGTILTVRAAKQKTVELAEVWEDFKAKAWRLILVEILVGLIIIVGLVLLIIPGIYFLGRVILAPFVLIDQNTGVREAINRSWEMTKGKMWQVYNVLLFTILLSLPNIIPVVGPPIAFVLVMLYSVAMPLRYYELKGKA
jgi:hypothetical protein